MTHEIAKIRVAVGRLCSNFHISEKNLQRYFSAEMTRLQAASGVAAICSGERGLATPKTHCFTRIYATQRRNPNTFNRLLGEDQRAMGRE